MDQLSTMVVREWPPAAQSVLRVTILWSPPASSIGAMSCCSVTVVAPPMDGAQPSLRPESGEP